MITNLEYQIINQVKEIRISKGFTQEDLANILEKTVSFIRNIESNKLGKKYNIDHLSKIAFLFDLEITEFFPKNHGITDIETIKRLKLIKESIAKTKKNKLFNRR
ncbi:MAG: helix-turn-helix transcriptional regulator [Spirochaetia bacterium]|nr:helix-turn-helix transcriptional regulator [Spirochaetia bacterium]